MITISRPRTRLPRRVTTTPIHTSGHNLAKYHCPGCDMTWTTNRALVADLAYWHAARCTDLRDLNRAALTCWNCNGTGHIGQSPNSACLVCLGRKWTTEPDPTEPKRPR